MAIKINEVLGCTSINTTMSPRHYADQICQLQTREERLKALMSVPNEWKDLVKKHVENYFEMRKK